MELHLLDEVEVRVLGTLLEKKLSTPDIYPLSLNALATGCNQKSSREPVMSLDEAAVLAGVEGLRDKGYAMKSDWGRVRKYAHLFREKFEFLPRDEAILAVLLLRGPQTASEIRSRCERLHHFDQPDEIEKALLDLTRTTPQWVTRLPLQPGRKEVRYAHLLMGEPDLGRELASAPRANPLAEEVAELRRELDELKAAFLAFKANFD